MHRGGFCRFSMSRYSSDKSNLNDLGSHLTNVAVTGQKCQKTRPMVLDNPQMEITPPPPPKMNECHLKRDDFKRK